MISQCAVIGCYILPLLGAAKGFAFTYLALMLSLCAYIAGHEFLLSVGLVAQTTINAAWYTMQFVYPTFWPSITAWWYTVLPARLVPSCVRLGDLLLHPLPLVLHWPLADSVSCCSVAFAFALNRVYSLLTDRQMYGCGAKLNEIYQFNPPVTCRQLGTAYSAKMCVYVYWIGRTFPEGSLTRAVLSLAAVLGYVGVVFLSKEWEHARVVGVQTAVNARLWAVWRMVCGAYWGAKYAAAKRWLKRERHEVDRVVCDMQSGMLNGVDRLAEWLLLLPSVRGAAALVSVSALFMWTPIML